MTALLLRHDPEVDGRIIMGKIGCTKGTDLCIRLLQPTCFTSPSRITHKCHTHATNLNNNYEAKKHTHSQQRAGIPTSKFIMLMHILYYHHLFEMLAKIISKYRCLLFMYDRVEFCSCSKTMCEHHIVVNVWVIGC